MKTKDLIARLQECDPSGETQVCVDNADIWLVDVMPAYYDGPLQVLQIEDERAKSGALIRYPGDKILIRTLSLKDAAEEHWKEGREFPIEIVGDTPECTYAKKVAKWRAMAFVVTYSGMFTPSPSNVPDASAGLT